MFVAVDESRRRIVADDYVKGSGPVMCPECGEKLVFKNGKIKVSHFAHQSTSTCEYGKGETNEHLEVKQYLYRYFKNRGIDQVYPEYTVWNDIRPDVAVNIKDKWVGFEVQKSQISIQDIQTRMQRNNSHGIYNIWILPQGLYDKMRTGREFRLSEQNIYLKNLYYGILYVYGDGVIHAVRCQNAYSSYEGGYDCCGEYHEEGYRKLKKTFEVTRSKIVDLLSGFEFCDKPEYKGYVYYPKCKIFKLKGFF